MIPASAVIMGVVMIWLAISTNDGLVVDDYYRHGKSINKVLKRDIAAAEYRLDAKLNFNFDQRLVNMKLTALPGFDLPDEIAVRFLNATRAGLDRELILKRTDAENYTAVLSALNTGQWYIQIEAGDWRLLGSLSVPGNKELHLRAVK